MGAEVHAIADENHAFSLQAQPLLESVFTRQEDASFGAEHTMPGQTACARSAKRPYHLPRCSGISGGFGHGAVGCDLPSGNSANHSLNPHKHSCALALQICTSTSSPSILMG